MSVTVYGTPARPTLLLPARTPASQPRRRSLTAAATPIDPGKPRGNRKRSRLDWQTECWRYYDDVNPAGYCAEFAGHVQSLGKLYAAEMDDDGRPMPTDDETVRELVAGLGAGMQRSQRDGTTLTGQTALLAGVGVNKFVAGLCYLHGRRDDRGRWLWDLLSVLEVEWRGGVPVKIRGDRPEPIAAEDVFIDLMRPHSGRRDEPVSALFFVRHELAQIEALRYMFVAVTNSHRNGGIFTMPTGLSFASQSEDPDDRPEDDRLTEEFITIMVAGVRDPRSAATFAPTLLRGDGEQMTPDRLRHIDFGKTLDENLVARYEQAMKAFAIGVDLPASEIEGPGSTSHWQAWLEDETLVSKHSAPSLNETCEDLTLKWLRPELSAPLSAGGRGWPVEKAEQFWLWWDDTDLVVRPDRTQDAKDAHERLTISDAALRREYGFSDDDAPDDAEVARRENRGGAAPDSGGVKRRPQSVEGPPPMPVVASAMPPSRLTRLAKDLHRLDVDLMSLLAVAADGMVRRELEKAGAKLRSSVAGDPKRASLRVSLRGVGNGMVAAHLGPQTVRSFGVAEDTLLADGIAGFTARSRGWLAAAQAQALKRIAAEVDEVDEDAVLAATEVKRAASLTLALAALSAGLLAYAKERLYDPAPGAPSRGEFDDLLAPRAVLRETLTLAGGGKPDREGVPGVTRAGGVGQGETAMDVLRSVGINAVAYEWQTGNPDRPFPPHERLNGVRFADFGDLVNDEDWPDTGVMYPGDHTGCQCSVIVILEETEESQP